MDHEFISQMREFDMLAVFELKATAKTGFSNWQVGTDFAFGATVWFWSYGGDLPTPRIRALKTSPS